MKEYIVSINFHTVPSVTGDQMSELLGVKSSALVSREADGKILWRLESVADEASPLTVHIESVASMLSPSVVVRKDSTVKDIYLDIAVLHQQDVVAPTVEFPDSCLDVIRTCFPDIEVEIVCYPCCDDEEGDNGDTSR
ncbi:MAG: hypothetical protein V3W31_06625 [Thermodesulfobacteriota bacterium]